MSNRQKPSGTSSPIPSTSIDGRYAGPPKTIAWREEQRAQRVGHHGINAYNCEVCKANTVTIDVDPGVTPMFLACRRTLDCKGTATSSGYPDMEPPPHIMAALQWEWTLPEPDEKLEPGEREWIDDGGLLLRPRTERPSAYGLRAVHT